MERDTVPHSLFAVIASGSGLALVQPLSLRYRSAAPPKWELLTKSETLPGTAKASPFGSGGNAPELTERASPLSGLNPISNQILLV